MLNVYRNRQKSRVHLLTDGWTTNRYQRVAEQEEEL